MIISKKRFNEEVEKRVCEEMKKYDEYRWRDERERETRREMCELKNRLIECEKKCGIDHPSHHHRGEPIYFV